MPEPIDGLFDHVGRIQATLRKHLGVEGALDPRFNRLLIHNDDRVQSRLDKHNAPESRVKQYAAMMGGGSTFPPIVLTSDGFKIDGNTRERAAASRNDMFISAIVVPVAFLGADIATMRKLKIVSRILNNENGLPLDAEERREFVKDLLDEGMSIEEIVIQVGMKPNEVMELRDQYRAASRLDALGLNPEAFPPRTLRAFGKEKVQRLPDHDFQELAKLTDDAGMKANEVRHLAAEVGQATTPQLKSSILQRERQAREPQITAREHGQEYENVVGKFRGFVKAFVLRPRTALIEQNLDRKQEWLDDLQNLIDAAQEIMALQQSATPPPPAPLGRHAARPQ